MNSLGSIRKLNIDPELLKAKKWGVHTYIARDPALMKILKEVYSRDGLCLKVFRHEAQPLDVFTWGKNLLVDCTIIQNIYAWHDLAPRAYEIVLVDGKLAQVTDFAEPEGEFDVVKFNDVRGPRGIRVNWDPNHKNRVGKWWVDFQAFWFSDKEKYEQFLVSQAHKYAAWGSREEPYQSILGMGGQRDFLKRVEAMGLDEIDFIDKSVLDIGCNLGNFCRYAHDRGARAVGVELPAVAEVAYEISNYLGYWDLDYLSLHLPQQRDGIKGKFDAVLALSVDHQIGYDTWMADLCQEVFYLEGHVPQREETFRKRLEDDFTNVEYMGMTRDHGPRPLFRCWR